MSTPARSRVSSSSSRVSSSPRASSSPRSSRPTTGSTAPTALLPSPWSRQHSLGAPFAESSSAAGPSSQTPSARALCVMHGNDRGTIADIPAVSPRRAQLEDDAFFNAASRSGMSTGHAGVGASRRTSGAGTGTTTPEEDASSRLAFHRMRFLSLDDSPPAGDAGGEVFTPSQLGPPLSAKTKAIRVKTPPRVPLPQTPQPRTPTSRSRPRTPQSAYGSTASASVSASASMLQPRTPQSRSRSSQIHTPQLRSPVLYSSSKRRGSHASQSGESGYSGSEEDAATTPFSPIQFEDASPWAELHLSPALVTTPPETPRRRRSTAPSTPPRSQSLSASRYNLPRSPGTPHLGRASDLMRTPKSPMTRSPGCRSLSSLV